MTDYTNIPGLLADLFARTSQIERVLNRLDNPEYSYTCEKGRVVSLDSRDFTQYSEHSGTIETLHRAVSMNNGQTDTLVLFNREVSLPMNIGDELWVVGEREGAGRLHAVAAVIPSLQIYANLTTDSSFLRSTKMYVLISVLVGLAGYIISLIPTQLFLGIGVMYLSMILLTTGLCLKLVCGSSGVRGKRASTAEWYMIERAFERGQVQIS